MGKERGVEGVVLDLLGSEWLQPRGDLMDLWLESSVVSMCVCEGLSVNVRVCENR